MEGGAVELKLDGYGYGYGYGDGSGYGDSYGDGSGYKDEKAASQYFAALLKPYQRAGVTVAFWKSTADGRPANGGSGTKAVVGATEEIEGPLKLCTSRALHGTTHPLRWKGEHWWIVELHHPVQRNEDKIGSLKRTFVANLGKCPFTL